MVVFPGGNNLCDRPILHYIRKVALIKAYDVLCISYKNINDLNKYMDENLEYLVSEVEKVLYKVNINNNYKRIIFVSKSLGNLISGSIKDKNDYSIYKHVFISPTPKALEHISRNEGLVITGTNDKYLDDRDREYLQGINNIEVMIVDGAGHSLETEFDIDETLEICKKVIMKVNDYID
jgi:uncharacterized protein YejL (UPF0352 family)